MMIGNQDSNPGLVPKSGSFHAAVCMGLRQGRGEPGWGRGVQARHAEGVTGCGGAGRARDLENLPGHPGCAPFHLCEVGRATYLRVTRRWSGCEVFSLVFGE